MSEKMKNKKVLVTGSGTGLGREIALEFARQGAVVVLHYSQSIDGANSAVKEIQQAGGKATAFKADLRDVEQAIQLAKDAIHFMDGLDVLVNNAGITMTLEFDKVTPEQFDTLFNVNVRGHYFIIQTALPTRRRCNNQFLFCAWPKSLQRPFGLCRNQRRNYCIYSRTCS
jgi:NAD(P)-dependent dehydrogenase (short-subunit alcohol dehydrogenase family)